MFPIGFQPTLQWYAYWKGCYLAIIGSFLVACSEGRTAESSMYANSSQPRAHKQQGEKESEPLDLCQSALHITGMSDAGRMRTPPAETPFNSPPRKRGERR